MGEKTILRYTESLIVREKPRSFIIRENLFPRKMCSIQLRYEVWGGDSPFQYYLAVRPSFKYSGYIQDNRELSEEAISDR